MADTTYALNGTVLDTSLNWRRYFRVRVYQHATATDASTTTQANAAAADGDTVLDVSKLRVVFDVKRFAFGSPNNALITIYNLSAGTENGIVMQGYRVTVEAGYQENYGQIFDGNILMCNRWKQNGTDYILQILALDGAQLINSGFCSFTYAKGQTARDVVTDLAGKSGVDIGYMSPSLEGIIHTKAFVAHGSTKNVLADYAKTINGTWFIDKGLLYMVAYSDDVETLPMGKQAVMLSEKTGLIGNPTQNEQGVNARAFINPQFMPYGLIHIQGDRITQQLVSLGSFSAPATYPYVIDAHGIYRIVSVNFKGDTRGNDWYADLTTVSQTGKVKEGLTYN